ncbi:MAG: GLPGLI family protein [Saprospiraceae bacterium]|nr:GLPGLI family protein [Saprospiraceae bacterium]
MKTIKIFFFIFCISFAFSSQAQTQKKEIIKVNYTSGCVSDFLVGLLKKQIQDAQEFNNMMSMMEGYKIHSSFYQNVSTKESVFVLDSISEVEHLRTTGHTENVYINTDGDIFGKEIFMGKNIGFHGNIAELNWKITNEQKEISGYNCKKAHLEENPGVYVWFTPEIAVNAGPYVFFGLPGLVLEANTPFESTSVASISYASMDEFQNRVEEIKAQVNSDSGITLSEVFAKKENFQRIVAKGTE